MFVYSGFVPFALVTVVIIAFYAFITYLLFAVPVQLWLRKKPKKFSLVHLFIYTAVAFLAVFLFWYIDNPPIDFSVFSTFIYYIMSIVVVVHILVLGLYISEKLQYSPEVKLMF